VTPALIPARAIVGSGHMIDVPGRKEPRFPPSKEAAIRLSIAQQLQRWNVGAQDVGICGAARGADILFAEECLKRGARVLLLIPLPEEEFIQRSVRLPGSDWEARYRALRARCETRFQHETLGPPAPDENVFARNNVWCLDTARSLVSPDHVNGLLVWDEKPTGDGPGGTSDFAARVRRYGGEVVIVNPTRL
jgi:hypothetical protein